MSNDQFKWTPEFAHQVAKAAADPNKMLYGNMQPVEEDNKTSNIPDPEDDPYDTKRLMRTVVTPEHD